jgi:endonuclease I
MDVRGGSALSLAWQTRHPVAEWKSERNLDIAAKRGNARRLTLDAAARGRFCR